ncbi:autotransporter domain-containing protein [Novosphingobium profundi]|uniref:autotransporter domain-containing protein n=1 Tax=Novosphingobium profundi TaxID=1774954 RepID=UPI001CFDF8A1|nr:autotransporter domain-containing protein [Novosphingobium profundi]
MRIAQVSSRKVVRRSLLLGSAAGLALLSVEAGAQERPGQAWNTAHGAGSDATTVFEAAYRQIQAPDIVNAPHIVVADPGDSTTSLDPEDVNGVGQMIIDQQNGFIGLCTGTLINPRTVIFAAHCVNDRDPTTYGSTTGGVPIGFGFAQDNYNGLLNWYFGGNQTNPDLAFYNADWVNYHPASLEPDAISFLYGDVAMASLDTPAADVPTWALMFSPLPTPDEITDENGTGYHVKITGYGRNGSGSTGDTGGIDYRRRAAENMLGALASLDQRDLFLFGSTSGLPQNLYMLDFDDPLRGTPDANPYDFNLWKDAATPNEGTTAGGDSGGPLILDETYDIDVVIGVLSGGSRFFGPQPFSTYGTMSFYQPLYLYWDWIAANNPYRYASAVEGDGAWEDPEHWVTITDPNYMVLDADGNLVNGVPDAPGAGSAGSPDSFGHACFQLGGDDICEDMATGDIYIDGELVDASTPVTTDAGATVAIGDLLARADDAAQATDTPFVLDAPTIANGLPGASDFVPDNDAGDPANGVRPTYYDVTLSADGTTTLSSAVTIDRFSMDGAGAALDITEEGSLTSLMSINQYQGMVRVDGDLATNGDYMLMTGGLQGSGTITTPYFTNVAGVIAPGGVGEIGTLTFNGNVILSSGSTYLVDLGPAGTSDLIAVNPTMLDPADVPLDGMADIGGLVMFSPTGMVRYGDEYTILTATGGIEGEFDNWNAISAILTPELSYTDTEVLVTIEAGLYADVIDPSSNVQSAYAQLLDQNRAYYGNLAGVYGPLDMMGIAGIQGTLEELAPREQPLLQSMATAALDTNSRFLRERIATVTAGNSGGTLSYYGSPSGALSALDTSNTAGTAPSMAGAGGAPGSVIEGALPDTMSAFVAGGYIDGKSDGAPTARPYAGDKFDGYYLAGGLEISDGGTGFLGMALSYTRMEGDPGYPTRDVTGDMFQVNLYGGTRSASGFGIDAQLSGGFWDFKTQRDVMIGTSEWSLRADDSPLVLSGEAGISQMIGMGGAMSFTPRVAFRFASVDFTRTKEVGGGPALQYDMDSYESAQARAGARLAANGAIKPYISATYVHDFQDKPGFFGANFVGGRGPDAFFALPGDDQDWGEIGVGITTGGQIAVSLHAETTVWRNDLSYQSYRGTVSVRF